MYKKKYGVTTFGVFIVSNDKHDIVFHCKEETLTFRFFGLIKWDPDHQKMGKWLGFRVGMNPKEWT